MGDASSEELTTSVDDNSFDYLPEAPSVDVIIDSGRKKISKGLRMRCHNNGHSWGRNPVTKQPGAVCQVCGRRHPKRWAKVLANARAQGKWPP